MVSNIGFKNYLPFAIASIFTLGYILILEYSVLKLTGGVIMYPLDDTFIHMQIAKNLAFNQTWGIYPSEFASASSSLLYTLILTFLFKLFSVQVWIPLLINIIAALILLFVIDHWLQKQFILLTARLLILLTVSILMPLAPLVISGMEHVLQCLFCFLFITTFVDWFEVLNGDPTTKNRKLPLSVIIYAFLVVAIRYEGMFLVAIACCFLIVFRRVTGAILLGVVSLLPVIIFGITSLTKGSYFLPNSLIVKSTLGTPFTIAGLIELVSNIIIYKLTVVDARISTTGVPPPGISLLSTQRILIILPALYLLFMRQMKVKKSYMYMLILLLLCTFIHLSFASTGWFYRYEAYLVVCALSLVMVVAGRYGKQFIVQNSRLSLTLTAILVLVLILPFLLRSLVAHTKAKQACYNIYEQQYQMARFLSENYEGKIIAANDIGAVSFFSSSRVVDLWGLGNIEVAKSKKEKRWTPEFLDSLARKENVEIAVVYNEWFDNKLFYNWKKVGSWQIFNNVICGGDAVTFYTINDEDEAILKKKLQNFQSKLPTDIKVVYFE